MFVHAETGANIIQDTFREEEMEYINANGESFDLDS